MVHFFETHKIVRAFSCYAANGMARPIECFDMKLFRLKVNWPTCYEEYEGLLKPTTKTLERSYSHHWLPVPFKLQLEES